MPKTTEQLDTRQRLIETAMRTFHARSVEAVGVAELCAEAGINKGSFYHFFGSKDDLVLAVIDAVQDASVGAWRAALVDDMDTPPLERFERFFGEKTKLIRKTCRGSGRYPGCPVGNLVAEMSTQNEPVRRRLAQVYDAWAAVFAVPLTEAVDRGDLPADTDVKTVARALVVMMQGLSLTTKATKDAQLVGEVGRHMFRSVVGLNAPRTAKRR